MYSTNLEIVAYALLLLEQDLHGVRRDVFEFSVGVVLVVFLIFFIDLLLMIESALGGLPFCGPII